jgi:hypothetical protein
MSNIPQELSRRVARQMHEEGAELTPSEVERVAASGLARLRRALRENGFDVPDDDLGLIRWLRGQGV